MTIALPRASLLLALALPLAPLLVTLPTSLPALLRSSRILARVAPAELARPNDNRAAAGAQAGAGVVVRLEARWGGWKPDADVDSAATVRVFGETGKPSLIPSPLLRVRSGTTIEVSIANRMGDSAITVRGLRGGTKVAPADDTLRVAVGGTRTVRWIAGAPGTYMYWGSTTAPRPGARWGRDGQLTGAIVVDPARGAIDSAERIFVLTLVDIYPDKSRPPTKEDIWEIAINGQSWPHSERLRYTVGDSIRWRWVNGTDRVHPMHLHGFHFAVNAKGTGARDTLYTPAESRLAVTELMRPGSTFAMAWLPTRAGNWLFHCHMAGHITPFPFRADSTRAHDMHDAEAHARTAMAGLVLGVTIKARDGASERAEERPRQRLRLFAQEGPRFSDSVKARARGFVLQRGADPRRDSVEVPGSVITLVRGQPAAITVLNRLSQPTSVHWHGLEITSVYDGVAGWSGSGTQKAPLVAPGDSFTVVIDPPRAGTFMYHTHMDDDDQLGAGLYGALLVLDPGGVRNPDTDRLFVLGNVVLRGKEQPALNGAVEPATTTVRAGVPYRLRLMSIMPVVPATVELRVGDGLQRWRPRAKDGAELPAHQQRTRPARLEIGVGETYDMEWTPRAGDAELRVSLPDGLGTLRQRFRVIR
ncbi:MAG: multicopper oxidase domain-containing protein [Gemmatimonadota bacterium]